MDRRFMFMKQKCSQGVVCPCPVAIYMHMTILFRDLLLGNHIANHCPTLYGASLGKGDVS